VLTRASGAGVHHADANNRTDQALYRRHGL